MKHIKPQSRPRYACISKEEVPVDPCEGLVGLALTKCRKQNPA
jgi:hypothetical protein